jgi:hypothetical protein
MYGRHPSHQSRLLHKHQHLINRPTEGCRLPAGQPSCILPRASRLIAGLSGDSQYFELLKEEWGCHIPGIVLCKPLTSHHLHNANEVAIDALELKRSAAQKDVIYELSHPALPRETKGNNNSYFERLTAAFTLHYWPPWFEGDAGRSIDFFIDGLAKMDGLYVISSDGSKSEVHCDTIATRLRASCTGLCLTCVKEGKVDLRTCSNDAHVYSLLLGDMEH